MNHSYSISLAVVVLAVGCAGPATSVVQTTRYDGPSRAYIGYNNVPRTGLALEGYCPVAYFAVNKPVIGKSEFNSEHEGVRYHFVSAEAKAAFDEEPAKYVPAYGGWCAFGMSVEDKFPVDPEKFKIVNGRLMLFLNNEAIDAHALWEKDSDEVGLVTKADAHWDVVRGIADEKPEVAMGPSRAYQNAQNVPSSGLALEGYCPVAYFAVNKPVLGKPEFSSEYGGATYRLVSAEAKAEFDKNPEKYVPAYGGWCAFGMSIGDKFPIDPQSFKIVNGRLLVFLKNDGVDAKELWEKGEDEEQQLRKAAATWKKTQG